MSIAFVLSGGASLGSVQVGMLEALYERGIAPDLVIGTSAGALNGAFIAERPPTVETAREVGDVWRGLRRGQVFPVHPITGALGILGARGHLVPDSGLRRLVSRHTDANRLEDTRVPLHVIATDVLSGEDVRLSRGLRPPDRHSLRARSAPRGALAMLAYATGLLVSRRLSHDIAALDGTVSVTVLPPPCPLSGQPTDFSHADALISRPRADARRTSIEPPEEGTMNPRDPATRVLLVADWRIDPHAVVAAAARHHSRSQESFALLVPAWLHGLDWAGDPAASLPCATRQLETLTMLAAAAGLTVHDAAVGDPDPLTAIADAIDRCPPSELLLCMPAHRLMSGPLDLVHRAQRFTGVPVSRVAVPAMAPPRSRWLHRRARHCVPVARERLASGA